MRSDKIVDQVRRNAVALISLAIAITSLGYNTWRNEHTEDNRNQRWASFEILLKLGELQELAFLNHYDCNTESRGNARTGWVMVQTIEDLTMVVDSMSADSAAKLHDVWQNNWEDGLRYADQSACKTRNRARFERGEAAVMAIRDAIAVVRQDVLKTLQSLD